MIIIYNLVLYHTFGNRKAIYVCYVASDSWVYIFRGNSNLKKKLSTQYLKKIKEFLLFDAWNSPNVFGDFLESGLNSDVEDALWDIIFTKLIDDIHVKYYTKHTIISKL